MDSNWLHLAVYAALMASISILWKRAGKPWCDRVSEAQRHPRLARIGLVAFLYLSVCVVLFVFGYTIDTLQRR